MSHWAERVLSRKSSTRRERKHAREVLRNCNSRSTFTLTVNAESIVSRRSSYKPSTSKHTKRGRCLYSLIDGYMNHLRACWRKGVCISCEKPTSDDLCETCKK